MAISADSILFGKAITLTRQGADASRRASRPAPPLFEVLLDGDTVSEVVSDLPRWRQRHRAGEFGADRSEEILVELIVFGAASTERASYRAIDRERLSRAISDLR